MTTLGYHASHEQLGPVALLDAVQLAERVGFTEAMCSDHFAPWSTRQGESAFAWSWLGAALQATSLRFGAVNAPGQRYHPAIIAQAIATLAAMYPDRIWTAFGSGENLNERITGDRWPSKDERNERLEQSVHVIRELLAGREVSLDGRVRVDRARLWTLPQYPVRLIAAAVTPETAAWAARWADGLITVNQSDAALRRVIDAYRDAGGGGAVMLQYHVAYADTHDRAVREAHEQWKTNVFAPPVCWDLDSPEAFEAAAQHVTPEQVQGSVFVSADASAHVDEVGRMLELGFDRVYLHQVPNDQQAFLEMAATHLIPAFAEISA
ncbi:MAG: TIGR03885 family FMN-dependent LLM class oxidoreductase [Microcella sp.]|uniref:TIGR03885 family FMN-dependent LLM class oxidoreductase n=1 Tax=Microcella sp. TaxID=1913979 RepID=UPI0024C9CB00|nr:TIGR03885 family FMN-dependent LLM class oxidoreductase [Microcella sp.]UYN83839.1 MAG: TIGR03885 family FMN-dependent LLM class oxidoreductase [Microcella sp.]